MTGIQRRQEIRRADLAGRLCREQQHVGGRRSPFEQIGGEHHLPVRQVERLTRRGQTGEGVDVRVARGQHEAQRGKAVILQRQVGRRGRPVQALAQRHPVGDEEPAQVVRVAPVPLSRVVEEPVERPGRPYPADQHGQRQGQRPCRPPGAPGDPLKDRQDVECRCADQQPDDHILASLPQPVDRLVAQRQGQQHQEQQAEQQRARQLARAQQPTDHADPHQDGQHRAEQRRARHVALGVARPAQVQALDRPLVALWQNAQLVRERVVDLLQAACLRDAVVERGRLGQLLCQRDQQHGEHHQQHQPQAGQALANRLEIEDRLVDQGGEQHGRHQQAGQVSQRRPTPQQAREQVVAPPVGAPRPGQGDQPRRDEGRQSRGPESRAADQQVGDQPRRHRRAEQPGGLPVARAVEEAAPGLVGEGDCQDAPQGRGQPGGEDARPDQPEEHALCEPRQDFGRLRVHEAGQHAVLPEIERLDHHPRFVVADAGRGARQAVEAQPGGEQHDQRGQGDPGQPGGLGASRGGCLHGVSIIHAAPRLTSKVSHDTQGASPPAPADDHDHSR